MKFLSCSSRAWTAPVRWGAAYLLITLLTRLTVMAWVWRDLPHGLLPLVQMVEGGLRSDLLMVAIFSLPWTISGALTNDQWRARPSIRRIAGAVAWGSLFFFVFLAAVEVAFFDEFSARFNYIAVDYLLFPTEVAGNIWQSYPVLQVLGGALVVAGLIGGGTVPGLLQAWSSPLTRRARFVWVGTALSAIFCFAWLAPPVGARLGDNPLSGEVAGNGHRTFFNALWTSDLNYAQFYRTLPADAAVERVRRLVWDGESRAEVDAENPLRRGLREDGRLHRPNVVVIVEESFGAAFTGVLRQHAEGLTPAFDRLARDGILFANFYATGSRTVRGLEAIFCGFPPIPGVSILKRYPLQDVFSWPKIMKAHGYETLFVYGGRGIFDNMRPFLTANGFDHFVEQSDFKQPTFTTAWGVCDEDIFTRALHEFDQLAATGRPFFAGVLTVSNHKPYTYPPGRIDLPPERHRREHAVKYADWALGRFFDEARRHAFFRNTLFVVLGDHGARVYGADFIPIRSYEIPFLIYAPALVKPSRVATLGSSLDVAPTVLGLLDIDYDSVFFGRDLFDLSPERGYALMQHDRDVGILRGDRLAVFGADRSARVFEFDALRGRFFPRGGPDVDDQNLMDDGVALYQTAYQLYRGHHYHLSPLTRSR